MNKITFPRVGYDGVTYTQKAIENWYVGELLKKGIREDVKNLVNTKFELITEEDREILRYLRDNEIEYILLCPLDEIDKERNCLLKLTPPKEQQRTTQKKEQEKSPNNTAFRKAIADAFKYDNYRQNVLVELAKMLNVKVCPYCNMHYTLYADETYNSKGKDELAKFQFDHFVNKNDYPMFSMSLYNLIPSCSVCNQGKYKKELPLALNPYYIESRNLFHFEVKKPLPLLMGKKEKDAIKIDVVCNDRKNSTDVTTYDKTFHISTLYSRHKDVVQEIFDKTYIASSARDIAKMLMRNKKNLSKEEHFAKEAIDKIEGYGGRYLSELWYGTYLSEKDIEKRPLTKFIQDIKKQSESIF